MAKQRVKLIFEKKQLPHKDWIILKNNSPIFIKTNTGYKIWRNVFFVFRPFKDLFINIVELKLKKCIEVFGFFENFGRKQFEVCNLIQVFYGGHMSLPTTSVLIIADPRGRYNPLNLVFSKPKKRKGPKPNKKLWTGISNTTMF